MVGWLMDDSDRLIAGIIAVLLLALVLAIIGYALWSNNSNNRTSNTRAEFLSTRIAENYREATVAARAVRNIRATETREANMMLCVNNPSSCEELGWNRERARGACIATAEARPGLRDFNECRPSYLPPLPTPLSPPRLPPLR